eukprot:GGOE01065369.1.p1 GENE.GGOE01065369.1~~GGOE01065369.1.p1  ORF type:complete len:350 (+),score=99.63 GGOE01065369.1:83-1132(+)
MVARSWTSLFRVLSMGVFLLACNFFHDYLEHRRTFVLHTDVPAPNQTAVNFPRFASLEEPPYPTDPAKPVIYLIQMEGNVPPPAMEPADFVCVVWKHPRDPCTFLPSSSWTQGRNFMWKKVVEMKKKYVYYVFMDEDITISNLALFEAHLLRYLPPVGVPAGIAQLYEPIEKKWRGTEAILLDSYDAAFDAFHYDVVHGSLILPYGDLFDKFSWWVSQLYTIYLTQVSFLNEAVGFLNITSSNAIHRNYPRGWNMTASDSYFNTHIVPNPSMRRFMKGYSWTTPGHAHPKQPKQRYIMSEAFIELADSESPYWKRVAEIRNSKDGIPPLPTDAPSITGEDMSKKMFGFK